MFVFWRVRLCRDWVWRASLTESSCLSQPVVASMQRDGVHHRPTCTSSCPRSAPSSRGPMSAKRMASSQDAHTSPGRSSSSPKRARSCLQSRRCAPSAEVGLRVGAWSIVMAAASRDQEARYAQLEARSLIDDAALAPSHVTPVPALESPSPPRLESLAASLSSKFSRTPTRAVHPSFDRGSHSL